MNTHPYSKTVYLVVTLFILGAFGWSVQAKEELIRTGQTVLLELAPVDPRSLMQGDYMRLNYKVADEAERVVREKGDNGRPFDYDGGFSVPRDGYVVVAAAPYGVARFVRMDDGNAMLGPGEYRLRYHRKWSQVNIVPNSFMFEEGQADNYARAEYGVFKFDRDGNIVLTGLADKEQKMIEPRMTTAKAVLP